MSAKSMGKKARFLEALRLLKRLMGFVKPYLPFLVVTLIAALGSVLSSLFFSIYMGRAVDCLVGVGEVDFEALLGHLLRLGILAAASFLGEWGMSLSANAVAYAVVRDLRRAAFGRLTHLRFSYLDSHARGDLLTRFVSDVELISDGLLLGFTQLFAALSTILATLAFMFAYNYKIALVVVLLTPLSLLLASWIARKSFKYFHAQSAARGELVAFAEEMVGNQKTVAAFGREEQNERAFEERNETLRHRGVQAIFLSAAVNPGTRFVNNLVYAAVAVAGAIEVISGGGSAGAFTVGALTAFLTYANKYTKPFNEISGVATELQSALVSAKRVFEFLDAPAESADPENAAALSSVKGAIELKNVSFSYDPSRELIKDLNLVVAPGRKVAIVGPTGSGKTTIINLLMRFYSPDAGEISLDGVNIENATRSSVRSAYGMVLQETWLKEASVAQNIAYGCPNAEREEIIKAAKAAHAHSFIVKLPDGYDTVLTSETQVSEGQKQLLCIARAMLRLPPMLILDEATSNIDTRTEIAIRRAFDEISEGRTTFTVAHRLSTIKEADCILVLDHGKVVEQGKHDELLAQNGAYAKLYRSQFENDALS